MNRHTPNGGVYSPITKFKQIKIPAWRGSIPTDFNNGKNIGVKIKVAVPVSRTIPTISKITLIIMINRTLLSATKPNKTIKDWGICSIVRTKANTVAPAKMNIVFEIIVVVSFAELTKFSKLTFL
jgi:hypothetical protein